VSRGRGAQVNLLLTPEGNSGWRWVNLIHSSCGFGCLCGGEYTYELAETIAGIFHQQPIFIKCAVRGVMIFLSKFQKGNQLLNKYINSRRNFLYNEIMLIRTIFRWG
jgi:hypothetical protein